MSIPLVPVDPEEFVNNNMMCEDLGCESKAVWTKKRKDCNRSYPCCTN